jgi:3-oxoacyl-[acyl-carrier-protein] synthase-3
VLLIGGETLTKITNWKDRGTCVLFGDGAGAVVLEESRDDSGILSTYWRADGSLTPLLSLPAGGTRLPASIQTVAENLHYIQMKGNEVFKHAVKRMGEAAEEALKRAGLTKDDIDIFIPHQANMRIIQAGGERLGLPPEKVYTNIDRYGNVSVACIPIAIHELRSHKKLKPGTVMLLDAFGAGFTWAAVAYRW